MNYFRELGNHGLRRLLKMILRRTIGPFLKEDIQFEQLRVESDTGLVKLFNLDFDTDMLNELLGHSGLQVKTCSVQELEVTISWTTINDGCKIILRGIRVIIVGNSESKKSTGKSSSTVIAPTNEAAEGSTGRNRRSGASEEESAGITFLANWVDIIAARMHVSIEGVSLYFCSDSLAETVAPTLKIHLHRLDFFNSNPNDFRDSGSTVNSAIKATSRSGSSSISRGFSRSAKSSVMASVTALSSMAGRDSKLIRIEGLSVSIICTKRLRVDSVLTLSADTDIIHALLSSENRDTGVSIDLYTYQFFSTSGQGRVLFRLNDSFDDGSNSISDEHLGGRNRASSSRIQSRNESSPSSVDLYMPTIDCDVNIQVIEVLISIAQSMTRGGRSREEIPDTESHDDFFGSSLYSTQNRFQSAALQRTLKILHNLEESEELQGLDTDSGISLNKVASLLTKYEQVRADLQRIDELHENDGIAYSEEEADVYSENGDEVSSSTADVVSERDQNSDVDLSDNDNEDGFFDAVEGSRRSVSASQISGPHIDRGVTFGAAASLGTLDRARDKKTSSEQITENSSFQSKISYPRTSNSYALTIKIIAPAINFLIRENDVAENRSVQQDLFRLQIAVRGTSAQLQVPAPGSLANIGCLPPTTVTLNISHFSAFEICSRNDSQITTSTHKDSIVPILFFSSIDEDSTERGRNQSNSRKVVITDDDDISVSITFYNKHSKGRDGIVSTAIMVKLNPVVLLVNPATIKHWAFEIKQITLPSNVDNTSSSYSVDVDLKEANIVIHSLRPLIPIDGSQWRKFTSHEEILQTASVKFGLLHFDGSINVHNDRWIRRMNSIFLYCRKCIDKADISGNSSDKPFLCLSRSHVDKAPINNICFRIALHMVTVRLKSNESGPHSDLSCFQHMSAPLLELNKMDVYLRFEMNQNFDRENSYLGGNFGVDRQLISELLFATVHSRKERKITFRKFDELDFSNALNPTKAHDKSSESKDSTTPTKHFIPPALSARMSRTERHEKKAGGVHFNYGKTSDSDEKILRGNLRPSPPPLNNGVIFVLDAHKICLDLRHAEYSFLIEIINTFVPQFSAKETDIGASDDINTENLEVKGIAFKLMSEIFTCALSDDGDDINGNKSEESHLNCASPKFHYILSTREPLIELFTGGGNSSNQVFVGLEVENLSLFELTHEQYLKNGTGQRLNAVGARIGPNYFNIPVLHGTTFIKNWSKNSDDFGSGTDLKRNCVLAIAALITENAVTNARSTVLSLDFRDVTIRADPLSRWIMNVVEIVTPDYFFDLCSQLHLSSREMSQILQEPMYGNKHSDVFIDPFETLHLSVTVQRILVDYCAVPGSDLSKIMFKGDSFAAPRTLLSIDLMTVGTTVISTSEQFGLKICANDLSLQLTNSIINDPRFELVPLDINGVMANNTEFEQDENSINSSDLQYRTCCRILDDFLESHSFVRMGTIGNVELMLRLNNDFQVHNDSFLSGEISREEKNSDSLAAIDINIRIEPILLFGCADSLALLAGAFAVLAMDIKIVSERPLEDPDFASISANNIATSRQSKVDIREQYPDSPYIEDDDTSTDNGSLHNFFVDNRDSHIGDNYREVFQPNSEGLVRGLPPTLARSRQTLLRPVAPPRSTTHFQTKEDETYNLFSGLDLNMFAPKSNTVVDQLSNAALQSHDDLRRSDSNSNLLVPLYDDDNTSIASVPIITNSTQLDSEHDFLYRTEADKLSWRSMNLPSEQVAIKKSEMDSDSDFGDDRGIDHLYFPSANDEEESTEMFDSVLNPNWISESKRPQMWNIFSQSTEKVLSDVELDLVKSDPNTTVKRCEIDFSDKYSIQEDSCVVKNDTIPKGNDDTTGRKFDAFASYNEFIDTFKSVQEATAVVPKLLPDKVASKSETRTRSPELTSYSEEQSKILGDDGFLVLGFDTGEDSISPPDGKWLDGRKQLLPSQINPHHIPLLSSNRDAPPDNEISSPKILLTLNASIKCQLIGGSDWDNKRHLITQRRRQRLMSNAGLTDTDMIATGEPVIISKEDVISDLLNEKQKTFDVKVMEPPALPTDSNVKPKTAPKEKDYAELLLKDVNMQFRMYLPHEQISCIAPIQLAIARVGDIQLLYFRPNHRTKKVLGYWKTAKTPRESNAPMLQITLATYLDTMGEITRAKYLNPGLSRANYAQNPEEDDSKLKNSNQVSDGKEYLYRISSAILPMRCFFDAPFIDLIRNIIGEKLSNNKSANPKENIAGSVAVSSGTHAGNSMYLETKDSSTLKNDFFFQHWYMSPISIKVDYEPRAFDFIKFKAGDYIEILNCFPPDGLELTTKVIRLSGVTGVQAGLEKTLQIWIDEFKQNQITNIANILAGTTPLRGIANIGRGVHQNLIVMPIKEFQKSGAYGAIRSVAGGFATVTNTVLSEALYAGHQASQMIASALNSVTTPLNDAGISQDSTQNRRSYHQNRRRRIEDNNTAGRGRRARGTSLPGIGRHSVNLPDSMELAAGSIATSMISAVENIVLVPIREYQVSGSGGAISSVIRAIPIAVLGPAAGAAEAVSYAFLGLRNQMDPLNRGSGEDDIIVDVERTNTGYRIR